MTCRFWAALGIIGALSATPALAASYTFKLQNDSKYEITGFETFEDSKWSTWSNVHVAPGEVQTMDWNSSEGDCNVPFRIIYKDAQTEQYTVDWCKISNIEVQDDKVTAN